MGSYKSQIFLCVTIAFALLTIVLLALHMVNVQTALTGSQMKPLKVMDGGPQRAHTTGR
jgi:hypothetical protein